MTDITDLKIFARVVRTGNMSAAGRELGYSPAVISKRVGHLEERLGARLFQRTTRRLTLTETGEGYYRRVVDILSLVEEAENFVSRRNTTPSGTLRLSAPALFSRMHLAPYLPKFLDAYPDMELDVQLSDRYVDLIRDGFDVALRIGSPRDTSMMVHKLAPNKSVLCATPEYLDVNGEPKSLGELDHFECITAGEQDQWHLMGPEGEQNYRVRGKVRTNSCEFAKVTLLAHQGIGLFSTWAVGEELKDGRLKVVLPEYRGISDAAISALFPSRDFVPEKVKVFLEFLKELPCYPLYIRI